MTLPTTDLSLDALRAFHRVATEADDLLETCQRDHRSLRATCALFLPALQRWVGARAARLTTRDEHLREASYTWGPVDALDVAAPRAGSGCEVLTSGERALWQPLDLAGTCVGQIEVLLPAGAPETSLAVMLLDAACEELDGVLGSVHGAARKQKLILDVTEQLTNPVFDLGVDRAVAMLHGALDVHHFALLYRGAVDPSTLHYRVYEHGKLLHESEHLPHPGLERALAENNRALVDASDPLFGDVLGLGERVENVLLSGLRQSEWLGRVVCTASRDFSVFDIDVVEVMCRAVSQRLVDFNRERRHLAQFFTHKVISELLRDPQYAANYLAPREAQDAVLYADINSFTKISEQVLKDPGAISRFVDRWSQGAVELLWKHGGVFDKMVGDCIIGHFGPPFFREPPAERALRAALAARDIAAFTAELEREAPYDAIPRSGVVPGLGVAIGLNLCPISVGLFGPNQDYTGFSAGMNCTARLQSLAGFRQTLAMDTFCDALESTGDPLLSTLRLGDWTETAVKNVKHPLRYRSLRFD